MAHLLAFRLLQGNTRKRKFGQLAVLSTQHYSELMCDNCGDISTDVTPS